MADGNWTVAAYIDERADDKQTEALGAIFTGAAGAPIGALAPLIGKNLGARKVPITYRIDGNKRSAEIPGILQMSVAPLLTAPPGGEMWVNAGHPFAPDKLALAVGALCCSLIEGEIVQQPSGNVRHVRHFAATNRRRVRSSRLARGAAALHPIPWRSGAGR